jgi:hypothetical protein
MSDATREPPDTVNRDQSRLKLEWVRAVGPEGRQHCVAALAVRLAVLGNIKAVSFTLVGGDEAAGPAVDARRAGGPAPCRPGRPRRNSVNNGERCPSRRWGLRRTGAVTKA